MERSVCGLLWVVWVALLGFVCVWCWWGGGVGGVGGVGGGGVCGCVGVVGWGWGRGWWASLPKGHVRHSQVHGVRILPHILPIVDLHLSIAHLVDIVDSGARDMEI